MNGQGEDSYGLKYRDPELELLIDEFMAIATERIVTDKKKGPPEGDPGRKPSATKARQGPS